MFPVACCVRNGQTFRKTTGRVLCGLHPTSPQAAAALPFPSCTNTLNSRGHPIKTQERLHRPRYPSPAFKAGACRALGHEGCIIPENPRDKTFELITKVQLWNSSSANWLYTELEKMSEYEPQANKTCGLHIHVSFASWGTRIPRLAKKLLLEKFFQDQEFLFGLNGLEAKNRWENDFCPPLMSGDLHEYEKSYACKALYVSSGLKGVEFRLFAGTFDPERVANITDITIRWFEAALLGEELALPPHLQNWANQEYAKSWFSERLAAWQTANPRPQVKIGDLGCF